MWIQLQDGPGTELEPETWTVGTVSPEPESGAVGTVFQEPEHEPSLFLLKQSWNREKYLSRKEPSNRKPEQLEPSNAWTATEPNRSGGHPAIIRRWIRVPKLNTNFLLSNFLGTPGISCQKSRDVPPQSLVSLGFEGHPELFGPNPFTPPPHPKLSGPKV